MDELASLAFVKDQFQKLSLISRELLISELKLEGWDVFVTLVRRKDGRKHTVRLRCDNGYPLRAPSVVFVNPDDMKIEGQQFWPEDGERAFKRSNNPPFICVRGIREYHERHNEAFNPADASLPGIVTMIVTMMNR